MSPVHAFTVDLEDWHQMMSRRLTGQYSEPTPATTHATHHLLDLLDEVDIRATFFVVGVFAERFPELVREVHHRGHEIASHTYTHRPIFTLSADDFRADVGRSLHQLEDLTGTRVEGFRAPEFSVGSLTHWCFEVMAELGLRYDSSVFPMAGPRYGIAGAPLRPFTISTKAGALWEFPLATWKWHGRSIPLGGGTYYRFLPQRTVRRAVRELKAEAVFYFHPYEFHNETLRLTQLGVSKSLTPAYIKYRILHNFRTPRIMRTLRPILSENRFRPLRETCAAFREATA